MADCYNAFVNKRPSAKTMYRALLRRDTNFEGIFYAGVRTTRIFCRPTCPAKKPKPENVEYFATPQEAISGGYHPCSRCRPLCMDRNLPEVVQRLLDAVEQSPTGKLTDSELRGLGIDPATARRRFKRYFGMTFHAYHRARRMGLALSAVRSGEAIICAQLDNGFESASGFWGAFKRVFGTTASQAERVNCLHARWIKTPLGLMIALAKEDGLYLLEFVDRQELESEISLLRRRTNCVVVPGNNPHLDRITKELKDYFDGIAMRFTVPLVTTGSAFERDVWATLQTIPPGESWSYAQLANKVGRPAAVRAVGRANGKNCLALVIPCHRVIRADGSLCGYGGGVWRKRWMLQHERRIAEQAM